MIKRLFILIFIFASAHYSWAQQLQNKVVNRSSGKPLAHVLVYNVSNQLQVLTDSLGQFTIMAKKGDRIKFSKDDFYSKELLLLDDDWNVIDIIALERKGMINAVDSLQSLSQYQQDSIERFRMYEHILTRKTAKTRIPRYKEQKTGGPFVVESPISGLLDKRSRKTKERKAFASKFYATEQQLYIASRYSDSLITSLTGLYDNEDIRSFKEAYPADYAFCRHTNDLEFNSWIKGNYKLWLKRKK